jgi:hypothetical protein
MSASGTRKFSYYSFAKILSFNATMNHCVGGRGIGKTYGAKKKVTRDAIRNTAWVEAQTVTMKRGIEYQETKEIGECSHQFIYVRRYKEELQMAQQTFFADYQHEFPDYDFRAQGWEAQMSPVKYGGMTKGRPWVTIGFFVPLSVANKFKSVAFPNVKWIIYDEYILEKGATHYLPNEAVAFDNFYSTVDRYKDKTRVLFLANAVSITNPFFLARRIRPDDVDEQGFVKLEDGYVVAHFIESDQFESEVYQTKFGKYIQGTAYADYAVGNQFADNSHILLGQKGGKAYYMFSIEDMQGRFSVWFDPLADKYFFLERGVKDEKVFVMSPQLMAENKTLLTKTNKSLTILHNAFNHDRMRFDTDMSRNAFVEIFK